MKKITLLTLVFAFNITCYSQIIIGYGIHNIDSCKFENQNTMIKLDTSVQNIWQIGKPTKTFFDSAYSATNAVVTDTLNPYPISNHSYFDLTIPYMGAGNTILGFKHKFQTDTLIDGGYIETSIDKGLTWTSILYNDTIIIPFGGQLFTENLYSHQDTLKGGINGFSGTSNDWINTRIQWVWMLPTKSYPPDTVIVRFHFISDNIQTNKDGWMIDDILISYADLPGNVTEFNSEQLNLDIYPNPANNEINIKFENQINECLIEIYNISGIKVKEVNFINVDNNCKLSTEDLNSGFYFLTAKNKKGVLGKAKLMIIK